MTDEQPIVRFIAMEKIQKGDMLARAFILMARKADHKTRSESLMGMATRDFAPGDYIIWDWEAGRFRGNPEPVVATEEFKAMWTAPRVEACSSETWRDRPPMI